jgi:hypothetical protein
VAWYEKRAKNVPREVSESIVRLSLARDFMTIVDWLKSAKEEEDAGMLFEIDDRLLRMRQGRAQALRAVLEAVAGARDALD